MCTGPCWKLWAEWALDAFVLFAGVMGWDLDGGLLGRYLDRQIEAQMKKDAEKAAEDEKLSLGDEESGKGAIDLNKG